MAGNDTKYKYPTLEEAGIAIPSGCDEQRFRQGFDHSIRGGQLNKIEYLKKSFRYGFRAGRLFLKDVRKANGIVEFPFMGKIKMKVGDRHD